MFDEQLRRMSGIAHRLPPPALLLGDESFAGTNEREPSDIADDVLLAMTGSGITVVLVTHPHELAGRFTRVPRCSCTPSGCRTADAPHRLVTGPADATGFATDLFDRTFGAGAATDELTRGSIPAPGAGGGSTP